MAEIYFFYHSCFSFKCILTNSVYFLGSDISIRLSSSGLNNEFFARACLEWRGRLAEGEFTPESQQRRRSDADRDRSRLDPWKLKHFEPIWGDRGRFGGDNATALLRPPIRTTIKLRPATLAAGKGQTTKRLRTVGAVTRSCTSYKVSEFMRN